MCITVRKPYSRECPASIQEAGHIPAGLRLITSSEQQILFNILFKKLVNLLLSLCYDFVHSCGL